jgi:hypothetical protein
MKTMNNDRLQQYDGSLAESPKVCGGVVMERKMSMLSFGAKAIRNLIITGCCALMLVGMVGQVEAAIGPLTSTFETDFGDWVNNTTDDNEDWTRNSGGTGSGGTGPTGANNGTWYIYTEVSSPVGANDTFALDSTSSFSASANIITVSFYVHMFGPGMGNLEFQVSNNGGTSYQTVWNQNGQLQTNQNDAYQQVVLNLDSTTPSFTSGTVQFRFLYTYGSSYQGDAALDDITISGADRCDATAVLDLTASNPTGSSIDLSWSGGAGTTSFDLYRSISASVDTSGVALATGISTPYTDSDTLSPTTTYYYKLKQSGTACTVDSNETSATTLATSPQTTVGAMSFSGVSSSSITVQVGFSGDDSGASNNSATIRTALVRAHGRRRLQ